MTKAGKRRLNSHGSSDQQDIPLPNSLISPVKRDLLEQYYPIVRTLRQHVLSRLPKTSRIRRRKIAMLGSKPDCSSLELRLASFLDTALVCTSGSTPTTPESEEEWRWQQWQCFSQGGDESYVTLSDGISNSIANQAEIVDFVIWLLFSRHQGLSRPKHLLCDGFRRGVAGEPAQRTAIPGIIAVYANVHAKAMKEEPWPRILSLLGQSGQRVMLHLLVDCSLFVGIEAGWRNYYQHTGVPLSDLTIRRIDESAETTSQARKLSDITLVRSRMFYAKPTFTSRGLVKFGFRHIHAINRFRCSCEQATKKEASNEALEEVQQRREGNTIKLMMYIFPRQFGLHNVFTSSVDPTQTAQRFQDYTLRQEDEMMHLLHRDNDPSGRGLPKIPKRLRGLPKDLIQRLQTLHSRCSYFELLKHYCPTSIDNPNGSGLAPNPDSRSAIKSSFQASTNHGAQTKRHIRTRRPDSQLARGLIYDSLIELATPYAHVSAFCQAVLSKIIPDSFWGDGANNHNKTVFLGKISHFVRLRRFESISLHELAQDFKITDMTWLQPPNCRGLKTSQTDINKRYELFHEFLYYVFDSLLIPLIRSHFYVTESNTHRLQIFYFRHDIWTLVADSAMSDLKTGMFEEIGLDDAKRILNCRRLGFSQIRLLPKGRKMRPIANLKRRHLTVTKTSKVLVQSINSMLHPVHSMLKHEKEMNSSKLGSALFSVGDVYERLKAFKQSLKPDKHVFYFAKLDVTAAFDTIPQSAVVDLMHSIPRQKQYVMAKHVEIKVGNRPLMQQPGSAASRPSKRWHTTAIEDGESASFLDRLETRIGKDKRNVVFIDSPVLKVEDANALLSLLAEHVGQNIVRIGKKFYRQKKGIPQGSVLSSFMCNYFYADLEARHLDFLQASDSLLMRLIDDFLLITLDKAKAIKFVEMMHRGFAEYGVEVNPGKTLVNFDMKIGNEPIRKLPKASKFPYCGTLIDCQTLDISKNHERDKSVDISASLTIDYGRSPGQNFQKKILHAFRLQSHLMFFDTAHNSADTVLQTLDGAFSETATKMWAYIRCLPAARRPGEKLIIRTIAKLADVSFLILTSKSRKRKYEQYSCDIRRGHVILIAYSAFLGVLSRKQTQFGTVISWLRNEIARLQSTEIK